MIARVASTTLLYMSVKPRVIDIGHILVECDGQEITHVFPEIKLHLFTIVIEQFFMGNNGDEAHCGNCFTFHYEIAQGNTHRQRRLSSAIRVGNGHTMLWALREVIY